MENKFYTYVWLREVKDVFAVGTPYYVGKGTKRRGFTKTGHKEYPPKNSNNIIVYPANSEQEALETEIALIWYYGRIDKGTGSLCNLTDGGDGMKNAESETTHCIRGHERTSETFVEGRCLPCRKEDNANRFPELIGLSEEDKKKHKSEALSKAIKELYKTRPELISKNSENRLKYYALPGSKEKTSKATKDAMDDPELRKHLSFMQKKRMEDPKQKELVIRNTHSVESREKGRKTRNIRNALSQQGPATIPRGQPR